MFASAPAKLKVLLALLVVGRLLEGLVVGSLLAAVLWSLLMASLSIRALSRTRSAARILGYLCYALGALSVLLPLLHPSPTIVTTSASAPWGALAIYTGWVLLRSAETEAFFAG